MTTVQTERQGRRQYEYPSELVMADLILCVDVTLGQLIQTRFSFIVITQVQVPGVHLEVRTRSCTRAAILVYYNIRGRYINTTDINCVN